VNKQRVGSKEEEESQRKRKLMIRKDMVRMYGIKRKVKRERHNRRRKSRRSLFLGQFEDTDLFYIFKGEVRRGKERPSLTVGHAPVLLETTGPKDADLPGLYWLGSLLAVATLAPRQLSQSGPSRPFIKALKTDEQRGVLCLDDRM